MIIPERRWDRPLPPDNSRVPDAEQFLGDLAEPLDAGLSEDNDSGAGKIGQVKSLRTGQFHFGAAQPATKVDERTAG
jgi:hypothetical protein